MKRTRIHGMHTDTLTREEYTRETERKFMLNYQFIGYVSSSEEQKILHAIEVSNKKEVAIHISKRYSKASFGTFLLFLLDNKLFPKAYIWRNIGKVTVMASEYFCYDRLADFYDRRKEISGSSAHRTESDINIKHTSFSVFRITEIKKIFYQLLDALDYLHQNSIKHGKLTPSSISIDKKCDIKICGFENVAFYDLEEKSQHLSEDLIALGKILIWMLYGITDSTPKRCLNLAKRVMEPKIKETLEYIFSGSSEYSLDELYKINGLSHTKEERSNKQIIFPDPIIVDHLKMLGMRHSELMKKLNDPSKKEYFIYRLYESKLTREVYHSGCSEPAEELYDCLRRRRYLIEKRRDLLERMAVEKCSFLDCRYKSQIMLELLSPQEFYRWPAVLDALGTVHNVLGNKIFARMEEANLEVSIERVRSGAQPRVKFTKNNGSFYDFIQFVECFIDEFQRVLR